MISSLSLAFSTFHSEKFDSSRSKFSATYKLHCNLLCQLIDVYLIKTSQSLMDGHMQERRQGATFQCYSVGTKSNQASACTPFVHCKT